MFSSEILEIVIGLVFVYLILSLLGTTINELISGFLQLRGKNLNKSLRYMLEEYGKDDPFQKFINHPVITKLKRNSSKKYPSYLSATKFSKVLIESITETEDPKVYKKLGDAISEIEGNTGKVLNSYWEEVHGDVDQFKQKMEDWFNEVQARATGWYKRNVQLILLMIGFIIAITINADTLGIVKKLSTDSKARKALVELSIKQVQQLEADYFSSNEPYLESDFSEVDEELVYETEDFGGYNFDDIKNLNEKTQKIVNEQLSDVNRIMGMGWNAMIEDFDKAKDGRNLFGWGIKKLFGFILTAIAISLGANFWFDILNKAIKIRNSGGLPEKKPDSR